PGYRRRSQLEQPEQQYQSEQRYQQPGRQSELQLGLEHRRAQSEPGQRQRHQQPGRQSERQHRQQGGRQRLAADRRRRRRRPKRRQPLLGFGRQLAAVGLGPHGQRQQQLVQERGGLGRCGSFG